MTGRRPIVSANRPPGSRVAAFSAATTRNPIPVHDGDLCRTSPTNSGTMALRTPITAKPSARLAAAAARYALLRRAPMISASGRSERDFAPAARRSLSRSLTAAMPTGTSSRPP